MSLTRLLGRSGLEVSAMGLGCWAIGGPFWAGETPVGWGEVDDEESVRAIRRGLELGITIEDPGSLTRVLLGHAFHVMTRAAGADRAHE